MNGEVVDIEKSSQLAEESLRALWVVDASLFEYRRCSCCGGLRHAPPSLTAPRAERDPPGS
jgi:hypothetical protein